MGFHFERIFRTASVPQKEGAETPVGARGADAGVSGERDVSSQTMLEKGQMDAHLMTLRQFSPEAAILVLSLKDSTLSEQDFLHHIDDFSQTHATPVEGTKVVEQFVVPAGPGRTIDVTLFEGGQVTLSGAAGAVH